jgi:hypothetical protein
VAGPCGWVREATSQQEFPSFLRGGFRRFSSAHAVVHARPSSLPRPLSTGNLEKRIALESYIGKNTGNVLVTVKLHAVVL